MYFPYLRGRQYELLALRELVAKGLLSNRIIPIIEPVKLTATLIKTMAEFKAKGHKLSVIENPSVGSFFNEVKGTNRNSYKEDFFGLFEEDNIIKAHILKKESFKRFHGVKKGDWLIINTNRDLLDAYEKEFKNDSPKYVLIPDERTFRRKVNRPRILLEDKFEKQIRNADYIHCTDEFFSDDHLYYHDDGFDGFADYSVIGNEFSEVGFAPYAVAIHIVYFSDDDSLRIKHFVSDSNDDIINPAKKFYEAVKKIAKWHQTEKMEETEGLRIFLRHYEEQTYPGLGNVKKLSIMHHLELIGRYLDEED